MSHSSNNYDCTIIGSGFSGSLLAWALARNGCKVALIDKRAHPRFTIGESSTPIADLLLEKIVSDFGNVVRGQVEPNPKHPISSLSRYGLWKRDYPHLTCGKKRGFSYFQHFENKEYADTSDHQHSMLVTASASDFLADTHWLRSDVDQHFYLQAINAGVEVIESAVKTVERNDHGWRLRLEKPCRESMSTFGDFIVDASGRDGQLFEYLGIMDHVDRLYTNSQSTFGHFDNVGSWQDALATMDDASTDDFPFNCDDSAQHHLLSNGWIWMLRFDSGVTSVGWTRPAGSLATQANNGSSSESMALLNLRSYPSLARLFCSARRVAPDTGLITTGRLQRMASKFAGDRFALIPTAGVTIDPLHSSGIAHGLSGVFRLADILIATADDSNARAERLGEYDRIVRQEAKLLDLFVHGCYVAKSHFRLFQAHTMFYFAAAIATEELIAKTGRCSAFWLADNAAFISAVRSSCERIGKLTSGVPSEKQIRDHLNWTAQAISPWNHVGLLDAAVKNMYRYTNAPK